LRKNKNIFLSAKKSLPKVFIIIFGF